MAHANGNGAGNGVVAAPRRGIGGTALAVPTVDKVMVGVELMWGKLHNNNGTTGDDVRFQFSAKYDFGVKL